MKSSTLSRLALLLAVALLAWPGASSAVGRRQPSGNGMTSQQSPTPSGDQKAGSILIYNFYKTDITRADTETEIGVTNTHQSRSVGVHFFFVSQSNCSVKEAYFNLTSNQTKTFRASDFDPKGSGYVIAVAVDSATGAPISHNFLTGSEYIKTATGHGGRLSAAPINALFEGTLRGVAAGAETATINFDGSASGYSRIPQALTIDNLTSRADGNDTIVVANRIGGNLAAKAASFGALSGAIYNRAGVKFPFSRNVNSCQMQASLSELVPNTNVAIPAGQTAGMNISNAGGDLGLLGVALNTNNRSASFADARNFNAAALSAKNSLVIPTKIPASSPAAEANLEMAMTANPPLSVLRDTTITYTLTSTNRGFDSAFNVVIRDTVPANTLFVSATPSAGGSCNTPPADSPGTVVCTFPGTTGLLVTRTVTLVVYVWETVPSGTEIVNTAETYSSTTDPNPSNNSRTVRTTVTSTPDELLIATNSLPLGRVGVPYSAALRTVNGIEPLTWFIVGGWLPDGLYLNANGTLAGAPAQTGVFPFRVRVIDGDFRIVEKDLTLRVLTALRSAKSDFDGDGKTDLTFWRGHTSDWRIIRSVNGSLQTAFWGTSNEPYDDIPTPGDYDGDGKTDVAIWRLLDSHWYIINSSDNSIRIEELGQGGDTPVPGDYDGDGKTDLAVWRGATSVWIIRQSSDGVVKEVSWGASYAPYKDVPVQADYDGDGKTDVAVWRGSTGAWYIIRSSDGAVLQTVWGASYAPYFDVPVPGDYDGDGRADVAVWRGATSDWWIIRSSDDTILNVQWGSNLVEYLDIPTPGDYDGDGKTDIAVWRSETGVWYVIRSSDGGYTIREHGQPGDTPIPRF